MGRSEQVKETDTSEVGSMWSPKNRKERGSCSLVEISHYCHKLHSAKKNQAAD
jgi:hypothetical protein